MLPMDVLTKDNAERTRNGESTMKRLVSPYGLIAIVSLVLLFSCDRALVPDAKLGEVFYTNRGDFSKLAVMSQQDPSIVRIKSDLTLMQTKSGIIKNAGLAEHRWQEYRILFKKLGVTEGLARDEAYPSAVLFYARCVGSAIDADCKGYAYSEKSLSPIASSLNSPSPGYVFKPLYPNWYLFRFVN
jgi:hypothetical protein